MFELINIFNSIQLLIYCDWLYRFQARRLDTHHTSSPYTMKDASAWMCILMFFMTYTVEADIIYFNKQWIVTNQGGGEVLTSVSGAKPFTVQPLVNNLLYYN